MGEWGAPPSVNDSDSHPQDPNQLPYDPGHKGVPCSNGVDGIWRRPSLDGTDRVPGYKGKPGVNGV